jgi:hypothetical protein
MGMALASVSDDHDFFGLDQINVGIAIIVNPHDDVFPLLFMCKLA